MLAKIFSSIPSEQATLQLINQFDKLIRKYSKLLNYEDSYNDLILFFLELIKAMKNSEICTKDDPYIINYICRSLKNQYILLSKQNKRNYLLYSDLSDEQYRSLEVCNSYTPEDKLSYLFSPDLLTDWENKILFLHYEHGLSISEIAANYGKTRQAVNQAKKRAMEKLKSIYY